MDEVTPTISERAVRNGTKGVGIVLVFDGKGGVTRTDPSDKPPTVPPRGFYVVSGNSRSPEYKAWLNGEIGDYNADFLTVPTTKARCTVLDDRAVVSMRVAKPGGDQDDISRQLLTMWIEKGRIIIASELNIADFLGLTQWGLSHHAPVSPADLVTRLGLRSADRLEPLIEKMGDRLDDIEEGLIAKGAAETNDRLASLRTTLINFRRLVWPLRDVLNTLEIEDLSFFTDKDRMKLREASGRAARLGEELQALSERAVLVHEQIADSRSEEMNRSMLLLAAVTVVFMPLTLITGILGMNVTGIPFAENLHSFWVVCVGLFLIAAGLVWMMRKRHWL